MIPRELVQCSSCQGTGQFLVHSPEVLPEGENPGRPARELHYECRECAGNGVIIPNNYSGASGTVEIADKLSEVLDKCNDILDKCNDIFEKVSE